MNRTQLAPNDANLLRRTFAIALAARSNGNHPFGALLADPQGKVLLEAENTVVTRRDLTSHAELNLIREASRALASETLEHATIYSSTEPCPMCAGAIHWSGVARLVFGLSAEKLGGLTSPDGGKQSIQVSCREILRHSSRAITVLGPALEEGAERVHAGFWEE